MEGTRLSSGDVDLLPGPRSGGGVEEVDIVEGLCCDSGLATIDINVSVPVLYSCMSESSRDGISCDGSVLIGAQNKVVVVWLLFVCPRRGR